MQGNAVEEIDYEQQLIDDMMSFNRDPYGFALYSFEWGKGELEGMALEDWQIKILCAIRDGLLTLEQAIQVAVASGHGVGKSALIAILILWAMATQENTRGVVTANTDTQLRTKTWPELSKWYQRFIAKHWFVLTATALYSVEPEYEKTWRIDMVPWSTTNTEAFAGLHNLHGRILVVFDEASAIDDKIWEVTEGAKTDSGTQIIWIAFGNPTRNTGRFHACFHGFKHRWIREQVDSRTVRISNKVEIQKWLEDYTEDSDFFRVRVMGEFPNTSDKQFIPTDIITAARKRKHGESAYFYAPKIIGADPAYSDEFAIFLRQGVVAKQIGSFKNLKDDMMAAGYLAQLEDQYEADAVFIDFGHGSGIASAGKMMGRSKWMLVNFGGQSAKQEYLNKRGEMWDSMRQFMKDGGSIPDDPQLCDELTWPEWYVNVKSQKIVLESKEDMRKRGLGSPNRGDALALTFAFPVQPKAKDLMGRRKAEFAKHGSHDYNPLG